MDRLEEETVKLPRVVVPIPPLETASRPETSLEPKLMAPLNREPDDERTTPVPKEERVVEPKALTENREEPEEEARVKMGTVVVAMFWTNRMEVGAVVLIPTLEPLS